MAIRSGQSRETPVMERGAPIESESAVHAVDTALRRRPAVWFFLGALLIQLGAVAAFNIVVNPYRLYPPHWVPPVLEDDYTTKLELLSRCQPRLLVLGSSRVRKLEPA